MKKYYLFLFLISILIFSCKKDNCEEEISVLQQQIADYQEQEELQKIKYTNFENQITDYKTANDSIGMYQDSIIAFKKQIKAKGRATSADNEMLAKYMENVNKLLTKNSKLAQELQTQIDTTDMSQVNVVDILFSNLEAKNNEIEQLQTEIVELKSEVKGLKAEVKTVVIQRDSIAEVVDEVIEINDKIEAQSISYKFYNKKDKPIDKPKQFIGRISKIKVSFTLRENAYATKGSQTIYMRIETDYGGSFDVWRNSINCYTATTGQEICYTEMKEVNYQGTEENYSISWEKESYNLNSGEVVITLYSQDGYIIGETRFTL